MDIQFHLQFSLILWINTNRHQSQFHSEKYLCSNKTWKIKSQPKNYISRILSRYVALLEIEFIHVLLIKFKSAQQCKRITFLSIWIGNWFTRIQSGTYWKHATNVITFQKIKISGASLQNTRCDSPSQCHATPIGQDKKKLGNEKEIILWTIFFFILISTVC